MEKKKVKIQQMTAHQKGKRLKGQNSANHMRGSDGDFTIFVKRKKIIQR